MNKDFQQHASRYKHFLSFFFLMCHHHLCGLIFRLVFPRPDKLAHLCSKALKTDLPSWNSTRGSKYLAMTTYTFSSW